MERFRIVLVGSFCGISFDLGANPYLCFGYIREKKFMALKLKDYIRQAKSGDEKAFKYLLEKYWNDVYSFQRSLIGNTNEAEDIAIETFAKAFEKIDSYNEKFPFKKWLITISKNTYTDRLRKKQKERDFVRLDASGEYRKEKILNLPGEEPDEEEMMILERKLNEIHEALNRLKPKYKEVLKYRYFDELSYREIAEKTGESISNVKIRLMRAKKLLAQQFKNE
jgi:RNA polymerase sigma-70 factor (ECF subfamily)